MQIAFDEVRARLRNRYGPERTQLGTSGFDRLVGVVLTLRARPASAGRAMSDLHEAGVIDIDSLSRIDTDELAELIAPAGFARSKAAVLRKLAKFIFARYDRSLERLFAVDSVRLRQELTSINGVGRELADAILLYAAGRPAFVASAAATRVLKRHGWVEVEADYESVREQVEGSLPRDVELLQELDRLFRLVGHEYCRAEPECEGCPLADLLPESGPIGPE